MNGQKLRLMGLKDNRSADVTKFSDFPGNPCRGCTKITYGERSEADVGVDSTAQKSIECSKGVLVEETEANACR